MKKYLYLLGILCSSNFHSTMQGAGRTSVANRQHLRVRTRGHSNGLSVDYRQPQRTAPSTIPPKAAQGLPEAANAWSLGASLPPVLLIPRYHHRQNSHATSPVPASPIPQTQPLLHHSHSCPSLFHTSTDDDVTHQSATLADRGRSTHAPETMTPGRRTHQHTLPFARHALHHSTGAAPTNEARLERTGWLSPERAKIIYEQHRKQLAQLDKQHEIEISYLEGQNTMLLDALQKCYSQQTPTPHASWPFTPTHIIGTSLCAGAVAVAWYCYKHKITYRDITKKLFKHS